MGDMEAFMAKNPEASTEPFAKASMEVGSTKASVGASMEVVEAAVEATFMEASTTATKFSTKASAVASTKAATRASTKSSTKIFCITYFRRRLRFASMEASVASTEAQQLSR